MGTPHSERIIKSCFKRKCRLLDRGLLWSRLQVGSAGRRCMSLHTGVSPSGLRHGTLTPICAGSNPATPTIAARWGSPREIITRWIHNAAQQARRWPALGMPQDHRLKTLTHSVQGERGTMQLYGPESGIVATLQYMMVPHSQECCVTKRLSGV